MNCQTIYSQCESRTGQRVDSHPTVTVREDGGFNISSGLCTVPYPHTMISHDLTSFNKLISELRGVGRQSSNDLNMWLTRMKVIERFGFEFLDDGLREVVASYLGYKLSDLYELEDIYIRMCEEGFSIL